MSSSADVDARCVRRSVSSVGGVVAVVELELVSAAEVVVVVVAEEEVDAGLVSVVGDGILDGFSGYNQIKVASEDQYKTAFITEWGAFVYTVMSFGLKNGPPSFNFVAHKVFEPYLQDFMRVFVDDFSIFGTKDQHLMHLKLCFDRCRMFSMALNPYKSVIAI